MLFSIGAEVVVRTLRNKRGTIIEAARSGRYRVRVEGITMSCRGEDLAAPPEVKKGKKKSTALAAPKASHEADGEARVGRVDLHGLPVEEGMARVLDEIDRVLRRGAHRMEIVHGKGSGRMRDALHRQLASLSVVAAFKLDPDNPGVTWVYF